MILDFGKQKLIKEKRAKQKANEDYLVNRYKGKVLLRKLDELYNKQGLYYKTYLVYKKLTNG